MEEQKAEVQVAHDNDEKKVVAKITSDKPKDPKRVAQGKRLAVISKEAKERKMRERVQAENAQNSSYWTNIMLGTTAIGAIGYVVYHEVFKNKIKNKDKPIVHKEQQAHQAHQREPHNEAATNILDMLE